jgi:uncharacterized damage-inducible protein DinB
MNTTGVSDQKQLMTTPAELLEHWLGHRRLTRRVIEAFPESEFSKFSIGGMRPMSKLVAELLSIAGPGLREIVSGEQESFSETHELELSKDKALEMWDEESRKVADYWAKLEPGDFQRKIKLFGQYEGTVHSSIHYFMDNEIHHRAQGYVYLRALGIEPPAFYDRS